MSNEINKYRLNRNRYKELVHFCRQYLEWKAEIETGVRPRRTNILPPELCSRISDPTGNEAVRRVELINKCKMIEQAAILATGEYYQDIIKFVASDTLLKHYKAPCKKYEFKILVYKFYFILDYIKE